MSDPYKYNIVTFHLPEGEKDLVVKLGKAYNDGWKPTGAPTLIQESFPGSKGGVLKVIAIYTLAKEKEDHQHG